MYIKFKNYNIISKFYEFYDKKIFGFLPTEFINEKAMITETKKCLAGMFLPGTIVTIIDYDEMRGFSFIDEFGNKIIEAGWNGFILLRDIK